MGNENQNTGNIRHLTVKELKPILDVFAQVTWPVPEAEIPALIEKLGWTLTANRVHIKADTHLPVDYTVGDFAKPHGELTYLMFYLTDTVDDKDDAAALASVQAAYQILIGEIQSAWGQPTGHWEDELPRTSWDLPTKGRLSLYNCPNSIKAQFLSPRSADVERYWEEHGPEEYKQTAEELYDITNQE
jgi:hypothetical protein